nr:VWA-like domain-containing protein [Ruminococcus bromii]
MALSESKIKGCIKRLLLSRMRILYNHGFYGLLLMHMIYAVSEEIETACTDGVRITFGIDFLDSLSDSELDFVMMHEILHVVLQHCFRGDVEDPEAYNIAADIVVNSNIMLENGMKASSITLSKYGTSMHVAPDGKEGHEYTAEQVYVMLPKNLNKKGNNNLNKKGNNNLNKKGNNKSPGSAVGGAKKENKKGNNKSPGSAVGRAKKEISKEQHQPVRVWDDHSRWGKYEEDDTLRDVWVKRFEDAAEAIKIRDPSNARGLLPAFAERILKELKKTQTDWRTILNDFIQEEVVDYSFAPPDRRFDDSPFFLPDFNGKEDRVEDILFMIDTSGSMSDDMIAAAYSEVKGAIDQFNGKLKGWLGFFDAAIIKPQPFSDENEFKTIKPAGGGGTDFQIIFEYVFHHMSDKLPASIIILSDGDAPFPLEKLAGGIPVLWLLNNEEVNPPWGKVARITV